MPPSSPSITAYNKLIRREYGDWDATRYYDSDEYLDSDVHVFSEELRVASTGGGPFGWVGGVFSSHDQDLKEDFYSDFSDANLGFPAGATPQIALTKYEQAANSVGVFAQGNFRFDEFPQSYAGLARGPRNAGAHRPEHGIPGACGPPPFTGGALSASTTTNLPSGKIELDYNPAAETLIYKTSAAA